MHELSIASSLVEVACASAKEAGATRVIAVRLRLGALSGVDRSALEFCYEVATADTMLAGSELLITELPVKIYCVGCSKIVELPSIQLFRCPFCNEQGIDIRQGRELEIESIEIDVPDSEPSTNGFENVGEN